MEFSHTPVFLKEAVDFLSIKPQGTYVDATAGGGGHGRAILERLSNKGKLILIDRDPDAIEYLLEKFKNSNNVLIIKDNFVNIASGKYVNPTDYYKVSNSETSTNVDGDGNIQISIGTKKVKKVSFIAKISGAEKWEVGFGVASSDSSGEWFGDPVGGGDGEKQDDGVYLFTVDVSEKDFNDYVQVQRWWGNENIEIISATVEFEGSGFSIDYKAYKASLLNE